MNEYAHEAAQVMADYLNALQEAGSSIDIEHEAANLSEELGEGLSLTQDETGTWVVDVAHGEANEVARLAIESASEWTQYTGPRGGHGWKSSRTGRVVYQSDMPSDDEHDGESAVRTLWRAADDDYISDSASFAETRDVAKLYQSNPGFGGANIYKTDVDNDMDVLDLTGDDAVEKLQDAIGDDHDYGAIGIDELVPRIAGKLSDAGVQWVKVRESYPSDTTTWIYVGGAMGDEPELEEDTLSIEVASLFGDGVAIEAAERSPKGGITLKGKFYRGGQWIPGADIAKLGAKDKERLKEAKQADEHRSTERKQKLASRNVDAGKQSERLKSHADAKPLDDKGRRSANAMAAMLHRHHGDLALHRIDEMAENTEKALRELDQDHPNAEGLRDQFQGMLSKLHAAHESLVGKGVTGKVERPAESPSEPDAKSRILDFTVGRAAKSAADLTKQSTGKMPFEMTKADFMAVVDPNGARKKLGQDVSKLHGEWVVKAVDWKPGSVPDAVLKDYASVPSVAEEIAKRGGKSDQPTAEYNAGKLPSGGSTRGDAAASGEGGQKPQEPSTSTTSGKSNATVSQPDAVAAKPTSGPSVMALDTKFTKVGDSWHSDTGQKVTDRAMQRWRQSGYVKDLLAESSLPQAASDINGKSGPIKQLNQIASNVQPGVKAYKDSPGDFTAAAQAAAHYARQHGEPMLVVPGNSNMQKVFHIARTSDDITGMGTLFVGGSDEQSLAIVTPDGDVFQGVASRTKKPNHPAIPDHDISPTEADDTQRAFNKSQALAESSPVAPAAPPKPSRAQTADEQETSDFIGEMKHKFNDQKKEQREAAAPPVKKPSVLMTTAEREAAKKLAAEKRKANPNPFAGPLKVPAAASPVGETTLSNGTKVRFVPHSSVDRSRTPQETILVDPKAVAPLLDKQSRLEPGKENVTGRRAGVQEFLRKGQPLEASRAVLDSDGRLSFIDGTHRFAELHEGGADKVALTVPSHQVGAIRKNIDESVVGTGKVHATAESSGKSDATPWHGNREPVLSAMRDIDSKAMRLRDEARKMRPTHGTIGVGAADMDSEIKAEGLESFLRAVRRGATPQQAADAAKADAREMIGKWNSQGVKGRMAASGKHEMRYWEGHADTDIETAMRSVLRASENTESTKSRSPVVTPVRKPAIDVSPQSPEKQTDRAAFNKDHESIPVKPMHAKSLVKQMRDVIGRYDMIGTAKDTGWGSDGKFMVKLPQKERDALQSESDAAGGRRFAESDFVGRIPTDTFPAQIAGVRESSFEGKNSPPEYLVRSISGKSEQAINAKYHQTIMSRYPTATIHMSKGNGPVVYKVGGEAVGAVMPMWKDGRTKYKVQEVAQPSFNNPTLTTKANQMRTLALEGRVSDMQRIARTDRALCVYGTRLRLAIEAAAELVVEQNEESTDDGRELADFYAELLTSLEAANGTGADHLHEVEQELKSTEWTVSQGRDGAFTVAHRGEDSTTTLEIASDGGGNMVFEAAEHAPKGGITLKGKFYRGGMWIPSRVVDSLSAHDKEKLETAKADSDARAEAKKTKRKKRGSVDAESLKSTLAGHASKVELDARDKRSAMAAARMLHRHHGDLSLHRIDELRKAAEDALSAIDDEHPNAEGLRLQLGKSLAKLSLAADHVTGKGVTGTVAALPSIAEPQEVTNEPITAQSDNPSSFPSMMASGDIPDVAVTAPGVSANDIPYQTAYNAHRNSSFVPERRAKQRQNEYVQQMNADFAHLSEYADTPEKQTVLADEFARYKDGYRSKTIDVLNAASRTASAMITGPARFPTASNQKKLATEGRRIDDLIEFRKRALKAIQKKLRPEDGPIKSSDPQAVSLLQKQLSEAEATQKLYRDINSAHKRFLKDPASLDKSDLSDKAKEVVRSYKPQYSWEPHPIPPYRLTNNNANIKRLQQRISDVSNMQSSPHKETAYSGGVRVVENPELGRIQVFFPGKPERAVIDKLKSSGFRWSPSEGAWQRHLNNGGRYAVESLLSSLGHTPEERPVESSRDQEDIEDVPEMLPMESEQAEDNVDPPETPDSVPSDATPPTPGFTGTTKDSLGREYHWVDGKRVAGPAEPPSGHQESNIDQPPESAATAADEPPVAITPKPQEVTNEPITTQPEQPTDTGVAEPRGASDSIAEPTPTGSGVEPRPGDEHGSGSPIGNGSFQPPTIVQGRTEFHVPADKSRVPESLRPHLNESQQEGVAHMLRALETQGGHLLADGAGAGKAQPLSEPVLTPSGWKAMGDISIGDTVVAGDGTPTTVVGVFPQGDMEVYRVTFSDGSWTECTDEHLWSTLTREDRRNICRGLSRSYAVRTLAEIRSTMLARGEYANHSIPIVNAVQFPHHDVALDAYVLGVLIGDGCLRDHNVTFIKPDQELVETVRSLLPESVEVRSAGGNHAISTLKPRCHGNVVLDEVRNLGLDGKRSWEKFVPDSYKFNSLDVRLSMLQGLMDTDGTVSPRGLVQFSTSSSQLADDVTHLVQSLGGTTRTTIKECPKYRYNNEVRIGRPAYIVSVCMPPHLNPFRLSRKANKVVPKTKYQPARFIKTIESVGRKPCQCIAVAHESHLYVTRNFVVTHNTRQLLSVADIYAKQGKKVLIVAPSEVLKPDWKKRTVQGSYAKDSATMGMNVPALMREGDTLAPGSIGLTTYNAMGDLVGQVDKNTIVLLDEAHYAKNYGTKYNEHSGNMAKQALGVVYATATPADKPEDLGYLYRAGVYGGMKRVELLETLGMKSKEIYNPHSGQMVTTWQIDPQVGRDGVYERMGALFDGMASRGLTINRELSYANVPVKSVKVQLPPEAKAEMAQIERHIERNSNANAGLKRAAILMAQRGYQEKFKVQAAVDSTLDAIKNGRQVVLFVARVNESKYGEGATELTTEASAKRLQEALVAAGLPAESIASMTGDSPTAKQKAEALGAFQGGTAKVIITTPESGGTGVNLDDQVGNAPRTTIFLTPPLSGTKFVQAAGRTWRTATKSLPEIVNLYADTDVDEWNESLISNKMKALGALGGTGEGVDYPISDAEATRLAASGEFKETGRKLRDNPRWQERQSAAINKLRNAGRKTKSFDPVTRQVISTDESGNVTATPKVTISGDTYGNLAAIKSAVAAAGGAKSGNVFDGDRRVWHVDPGVAEKLKHLKGLKFSDASGATQESPAPAMSAEKKAAIHAALKHLAGFDSDGARERNDVGFNQMDTNIGREWAMRGDLTDKQAAAAEKMIRKYHRQVPPHIMARATAEDKPQQAEKADEQVKQSTPPSELSGLGPATIIDNIISGRPGFTPPPSKPVAFAEPIASPQPAEPQKAKTIDPPKPAPSKPSKTVSTKKVNTKYGERMVHSFPASKSYWDKAHKSPKKSDAVSVRKNQNGEWEVSIWGKTDDEVQREYAKLRALMGLSASEVACDPPASIILEMADRLPKRYFAYRPRRARAAEMRLAAIASPARVVELAGRDSVLQSYADELLRSAG